MKNNLVKDFATKAFNMYKNHPFGKEKTAAEIVNRIAFETEAAGIMRDKGNIPVAEAHEKARAAYLALLVRTEETKTKNKLIR